VVGNKSDAAVTTVGTFASVIAYIKGLLNQVVTLITNTDKRVAGRTQGIPTTVNLYHAAGTIDVFTGTAQVFMLTKLVFQTVEDLSDDAAFTGLSIQTNDTTPQTIISAVTGAKAGLTAYRTVSWAGQLPIKVGNKIQLTIIGGTGTANPTTCNVYAEGYSLVDGGYLA
jgi:hypothetical protein